jgi:hypothetical protein
MAEPHIPMDDVQQLWNETLQHSWSALQKTLEGHKGKAKGIEDALVSTILQATQREQQGGHPFPDSPRQLYEVINKDVNQISGQD